MILEFPDTKFSHQESAVVKKYVSQKLNYSYADFYNM